jgi:carbonic anhydrase
MVSPATPRARPKWLADGLAGLIVYLVALPLCLGVAQASKANLPTGSFDVPLVAGILAGIIGGIVIGFLSGSHTSVSGPAAGLTAVVAAEVMVLGSFNTFLMALVLAGLIQIGMGLLRAGVLVAYVPASVIKGLLAAIGVILILKQTPHLLGHDNDPDGEMSFLQPDEKNTFTELFEALGDVGRVVTTGQLNEFEIGASVIGVLSLLVLVFWDKVKPLKKSFVPSALVVVVLGVVLSELFRNFGEHWLIGGKHLVNMPTAKNVEEMKGFLNFPNFGVLATTAVLASAIKIAIVASLETLLNLEAVDKLDPKQRRSPASRELLAQGVGNALAGLIGGIPVTSVIVRSSANINAKAESKYSSIIHGVLLLLSLLVLAPMLNRIPLSCLAAILVYTGFKLASPKLLMDLWKAGWSQFFPFIATVIAIVFTDLLLGVVIGLGVSFVFLILSNFRTPLARSIENHLGVRVTRIVLSNQMSFLNKSKLSKALHELPDGSHVLLDATNASNIDPDLVTLIKDFRSGDAVKKNVRVSLIGFDGRYGIEDVVLYPEYSNKEVQRLLTAEDVLTVMMDGHQRFREGRTLQRNQSRAVQSTSTGQNPLAIVLTCIDSRTPVEILFDGGIGDYFVVRVAGNISGPKVLGSMEYATQVAGAKLIMVVGHTSCGAVTAAVDMLRKQSGIVDKAGCQHLDAIVTDIQTSARSVLPDDFADSATAATPEQVNDVAADNVARVVRIVQTQSTTLRQLVEAGQLMIVGAMYDVKSGKLELLPKNPG